MSGKLQLENGVKLSYRRSVEETVHLVEAGFPELAYNPGCLLLLGLALAEVYWDLLRKANVIFLRDSRSGGRGRNLLGRW